MQNYYIPENLARLKTIDPFLHYQLEHMTNRVHESWQALASDSNMPATDLALMCLDLIDLADNLTELFRKVQTVYKKNSRKPFFSMIEDYNLRKTKIKIALIMYNDLYKR